MDTIILDLETAPLPGAETFLEPVQAARNLKDPIKIEADKAERERERLDKLALDWNLNRIVAIGGYRPSDHEDAPWMESCEHERDEKEALKYAWSWAKSHTIVGFYVRQYDIPVMIQRSRYLGIEHPDPNQLLDRYRSPVIDLFDLLTFRDMPATSVMKRSLKSFAKRFGLDVQDDIDGKDIPALVAAGEWEKVLSHLRSDLALTRALAQRLGVCRSAVSV